MHAFIALNESRYRRQCRAWFWSPQPDAKSLGMPLAVPLSLQATRRTPASRTRLHHLQRSHQQLKGGTRRLCPPPPSHNTAHAAAAPQLYGQQQQTPAPQYAQNAGYGQPGAAYQQPPQAPSAPPAAPDAQLTSAQLTYAQQAAWYAYGQQSAAAAYQNAPPAATATPAQPAYGQVATVAAAQPHAQQADAFGVPNQQAPVGTAYGQQSVQAGLAAQAYGQASTAYQRQPPVQPPPARAAPALPQHSHMQQAVLYAHGQQSAGAQPAAYQAPVGAAPAQHYGQPNALMMQPPVQQPNAYGVPNPQASAYGQQPAVGHHAPPY